MVDQDGAADTAESDESAHRLRRRADAIEQRFSGSGAGHLWGRLNAMDFITKAMTFAAVLLLCFFPFLIVLNALAGRSAVTTFSKRLGLSHEAAVDVSHLFASSTSTTHAVTGTAYVFFVLGGIAAATAVQELYERAFELEARGMKDMPRRILWLAVVIGGSLLASLVGPWLGNSGGPVLLVLVGFAALTLFWWFTMWLLLAGRLPWRALLPSAIATSVCWVGMEIVFSFIFSKDVIFE